MQFARLLYRISHRAETGVLWVAFAEGGDARLELERGWVHSVDLEAAPGRWGSIPPRGEDRLDRLLTHADGQSSFDPHRARTHAGACTPFHPALVLRQAVERRPPPSNWRERYADRPLTLGQPPHPSCLGPDERLLVAFLNVPRSWSEIQAAALCPPMRAIHLLDFLAAVGALQPLASRSAYAQLGLPDGASLVEIKHAFRQLARELHPDRHTGATEQERRRLTDRFAEITAAYRQLI